MTARVVIALLCLINILIANKVSILYATNRRWNGEKYNHDFMQKLEYGEFTLANSLIAYNRFNSNFAMLAKEISIKKKVLMFIHGYNTTFREAALKFIEFIKELKKHHDVQDVAFLLLSWPSAGVGVGFPNPAGPYKDDEKVMEKSTELVVELLKQLRDLKPNDAHILAHSMGAKLLWRAFSYLPKSSRLLGKIFWMAADVRKNEVQNHFASRVLHKCLTNTNYLCKKDEALWWSHKQCGGHHRMGRSSTKLKPVGALVNIKVANKIARQEDSKRLHTYFTHPHISKDIALQIFSNMSPKERGLKERSKGKGWTLE